MSSKGSRPWLGHDRPVHLSRGLMEPSVFMRQLMRVCALVLTCLIFSCPARADQDKLSAQFAEFEGALNQYIRSMTSNNWPAAEADAEHLLVLSKRLYDTGLRASNYTWIYYASNVSNHCEELVLVTRKHDPVDAIYLVSILLSHLEQIQSTVPVWLRTYLLGQLAVLESAIRTHDNQKARDAAEILHTSANKILLSISSSPNTYSHTNWAGTIFLINGLGDEILGAVNQDEWQEVPAKLDHIRHILDKWMHAFRDRAEAAQP